jgi:hypothetical protein
MASGTHANRHKQTDAVPRDLSSRARRALVNVIAALTVNAAIVLAIPRANGRTPTPIVLQQKRRLIDGRWEEGEYVDGRAPAVVVVALEPMRRGPVASNWITPN